MLQQLVADWTVIGLVSLGVLVAYGFLAGLVGKFLGLRAAADLEVERMARQRAWEHAQAETRKRMQAAMHGKAS